MKRTQRFRRHSRMLAAWLLACAWPLAAAAQAVNGQARAAQATVSGLTGTTTTALGDAGTLSGANDARHASQLTGSIPSIVGGEALHATTIAGSDEVDSESSIAGVTVSAGGNTITASFVMARATSIRGVDSGNATISGLSINGVPIPVADSANQRLAIPGGSVVINEQQNSAAGLVVNGLHVVVTGVADIVVASAAASVR